MNDLIHFFQTLNTISAEHNSTIIFPLPMDFLSSFMQNKSSASMMQPNPIEEKGLI